MYTVINADVTTRWRVLATWIVANAIALLALVQPYVYWVWKRYFQRGRIDVHPSGKVEVGYSGFGTTIALFGTLRAVYDDQFIRSIELVVKRPKDNLQRHFQWLVLRPASFMVGAPTQAGPFELASGFMLLVSEPRKYNILFVDEEFQARVMQTAAPAKEAWGNLLAKTMSAGGPLTDQDLGKLYATFRNTPEHVRAFTELDRMLDWQPVEYLIEMRVNTANPDKTFRYCSRFSLTPQDIERLRTNYFRILEEICQRPTTGPYVFAYSGYAPPTQQTR